MTVPPIQDLIVDVMAAAEPTAQRIATSKLERMAPASGDFPTTVESAGPVGLTSGMSTAGGAQPGNNIAHTPVVRAAGGDGAVYRKFEAFILQVFVESMLPQNANEIFGKGTAGAVWRSMLAEQISNEMAKGDGIGIAKQLAKARSTADGAQSES